MKACYGVVLTYRGRMTRSPDEPPRFRHEGAAAKERDRMNADAWFAGQLPPSDYRYRLYHFGNREYLD